MEVIKKTTGRTNYDPVIQLLDIYQKKKKKNNLKAKILIQKDTWTLMFVAALFTVVKIWKKLVSIDR